jgi:L-amino acid N-acyltransferase YncA
MPAVLDIVIREAATDDAERVAAIYNQAVRRTTATFDLDEASAETFVCYLGAHGGRFPSCVALLADDLIGWGALSPWSARRGYADTAEISIYVDENWQGRGVGRSIQAWLLDRAARAGLHTVIAFVTSGNAASIALKEGAGFRHVGTFKEVGHKFDHHHDLQIWQLLIRAGSARPAVATGGNAYGYYT